jgi:hypothetical protein
MDSNLFMNNYSANLTRCNCIPRILIVDDNEFNLMPLRCIIKKFSTNHELLEIALRKQCSASRNIDSFPNISEESKKDVISESGDLSEVILS